MYKTEFTRESKKNLSSIPKEYQIAVINSLKGLSKDPLKGKPLGGRFKGQYSLRVGVYRVVYIFSSSDKIILILGIKHRREAYK